MGWELGWGGVFHVFIEEIGLVISFKSTAQWIYLTFGFIFPTNPEL